MRLITVDKMKKIENAANSAGHSYEKMMDLAGAGVADLVLSLYGYEENRSVLGLIGSGNNGGDAIVALIHLLEAGWKTCAYLVRNRPAEDIRLSEYISKGGEVIKGTQDNRFSILDDKLRSCQVVLDGIFGTGVRSPIQAETADLISHVSNSPFLAFVVAVDCPSGVDCDTGQMLADCIPANLTICMEAVKVGLLKFPAYRVVGDLEIVSIGLPESIQNLTTDMGIVADPEIVHSWLPARKIDGNKGTFGTVMVVAGSVNYTGAALLASKAAYRIGCGLVRAAVPGPLHSILAGQIPEATWVLLPHEMGVISSSAADLISKNLDKVSVLVLGPGWGLEDTTREFLVRLLSGKSTKLPRSPIGFVSSTKNQENEDYGFPPLVIDADGLKLLAKIPNWHNLIKSPAILTPHPGEMSVLTGLGISEIQNNREEIAIKFAKQWGINLVLKGALTVVANPTGEYCVIPVATSALAKAGTGDVLAGLIAGLISQGVDPYKAGVAGAYVHAQAGLLASETLGHDASVLAGDVLDAVPQVISTLW